MNRHDRNNRHTALLLLACAFAFVYLLTRQFQGDEMIHKRDNIDATGYTMHMPELPARLENTTTGSDTPVTQSGSSSGTVVSPSKPTAAQSWVSQISFAALNALPQSFVRLWLSSPQGVLIDWNNVIVTTQSNQIKRNGDSKTFGWSGVVALWIKAESLTFYNDPSWTNIFVVMEVVNKGQSLLVQVPYHIYRDQKAHLNTLIAQLTQK